MCETPIKIPNKNNFYSKEFSDRMKSKFPWKDYTSAYIEVPCGHCKECIRRRQDSLVQRVQMESTKNHLFMCTLTYSPETLPSFVVNDYEIPFADTKDVQDMLKRMRKNNVFGFPFRYLAVSELGSLRGRPHFHLLFLFEKKYFSENTEQFLQECDAFASKSQHYFTVLNNWNRNVASRRNPVYIPLTRYVERMVRGQLRKNYDFHYINPFLTKNGVEDCGYYVLKYMFKPSDRAVRLQQALRLNLSPEDYDKVWSTVRPRYFASIGFGLNAKVQLKHGIFEKDKDILNKLRSDISFSKENLDYPSFFHPFTGKQQMISSYYLNDYDIYSYQDRIDFWNKKDSAPGDMRVTNESDFYHLSDVKQNKSRYEKTVEHCDDLGLDSDLDLLD